ncbi:MAG TPA: CsgG/HfaB family protein [bacterium]|nr:CsgG/HfaB family protein [bacterium]HPR89105.1 CsgG/HfaB family protein [bacterium]
MVRHPFPAACALGLLLALFYQGCAPSRQNLGHELIERGEYARAVRPLKMAIAENYTDIESIRDMGIAMYHAGKLKLARGFLRLALSRSPRDLPAIYYLGLVYEAGGETSSAIQQYTLYTQINPAGKMSATVRGRLQVLVRQQMAEQIKALLAQENALEAGPAPENSIAVLYFSNLSNNPDYTPLQKGLAEMIITDLAQVRSLQVVERARMQLLMDEMGLGMTGLVKEETAPRMGKLLSVHRVVQGTFAGAEQNQLQIDAALATLGVAAPAPADKIAGPLEEFYQLQKSLVFNLIDVMGLRLSRQEREAIQRIPTKNLAAFMAWCRGLDDEDRGQWQKAEQEYRSALDADPGFRAAEKAVERSQAFAAFSPRPEMIRPSLLAVVTDRKTADRSENRRTSAPAAAVSQPAAATELVTVDLLNRSAAQVTPGFLPGLESRKPTTETGTIGIGTGYPIEVHIQLPVKK